MTSSHQSKPSQPPTDPQLLALRELATFYKTVIEVEADPEDHPMISIWDWHE